MGINLLNFQLIWTVCTFVTLSTSVLFKLLHVAGSNVFLYVFFMLYLFNVILPIFYAIQLKNGKTTTAYPVLIRFIQ
ncbi:MAG: DUF4870 domain-containing protein [Flavobacteriales bacterium]